MRYIFLNGKFQGFEENYHYALSRNCVVSRLVTSCQLYFTLLAPLVLRVKLKLSTRNSVALKCAGVLFFKREAALCIPVFFFKREAALWIPVFKREAALWNPVFLFVTVIVAKLKLKSCLLYTSDAADE